MIASRSPAFIARNREPHWLGSSGDNLCRERVAIGVSNLLDQRLLIHLDQFVASGNDGDARPGKDAEPGRTTGCGCGDLGGGDTRARGTITFSGPGLGSHGDDVFAGSDAAARSEAKRVAARARTCSTMTTQSAPAGTGAPVIISTACPAETSTGPGLAGANRSNDLSAAAGRKIGSAAGKPVAGGAGKWRLIPVGINRLGQHHAQAIEQSNELRRMPRRSGQPIRMLADDPAGVRKADYPGWSRVVQARVQREGTPVLRRPFSQFQPSFSSWQCTWC